MTGQSTTNKTYTHLHSISAKPTKEYTIEPYVYHDKKKIFEKNHYIFLFKNICVYMN